MKKQLFGILSILISITVFISIFKYNHDLAIRYRDTDGKGRALFGIIEYVVFYYKYIFLIGSMLSIALAIFSIKRKEKKSISFIALFMGLLSVTLIF
jgi:hypothetical protein